MLFKKIRYTDWFLEMEKKYWGSNKKTCPMCGRKLIKKHEGLACQYSGCMLRFKLGKGWIYLNNDKKNNLNFFKDKNDFDIDNYENKKKWLELKAYIFHKRGRSCEICSNEISLNLHHILYRSEYPCLTFDEENIIILCEKCHKHIHCKDKWRFS